MHELVRYEKNGKLVWDDDVYLKPFMVDDALLHSFLGGDDDDDDDDCSEMISREEVMKELAINGDLAEKEVSIESISEDFDKIMPNGSGQKNQKDKQLRVSVANVAAREIMKVNENYFGAYGSFGIHREMLSDKVNW